MPKTELYIGNLAGGTRQRDIESLFDKYGRLVRCDVKDKGKLSNSTAEPKKKTNKNTIPSPKS